MSLKIASSRIQEAVLKGVPASGPPSLKSRWARLRYRSPSNLKEAFDEALKVIDQDAIRHQNAAETATAADDLAKAELHLAKSEIHRPEVKYNHFVKQHDLNRPVYKLLAQRDWQRRDMLILMQRLEQHHVIPDTLPTLDPQADVKLRFVTPQMHDIEPGKFVANNVALRAPRVSIRDFSIPAGSTAKYTVLIVNPDMPDVVNDTFYTSLNFAATNVEVGLSQPEVNFFGSETVISPYVPPIPEKNGPVQRMCVWVFRQPENAEIKVDTEELPKSTDLPFQIREFVAKYSLQPVGATMWRTKYDVTTPEVQNAYPSVGQRRVYFRARTAKPEEALLHISERKKWMKVDGLE